MRCGGVNVKDVLFALAGLTLCCARAHEVANRMASGRMLAHFISAPKVVRGVTTRYSSWFSRARAKKGQP
jgi:hypothetical protein